MPDGAGHIVIMNHLKNHPDNTLPNEFQLTLDTHFVAAVILYRKYGATPLRVIRKSRPDEFAHQQYYDRLGYIYVYRGHVDEWEEEPHRGEHERRRAFLEAATNVLVSWTNLVMCPEGSSTSTEESPLPFRPGAFRLAAHVEPEPLIVPIAVANFDKKITRTRVAAVVHEPFRISDVLTKPFHRRALHDFLASYRRTFRTYVDEARRLAVGENGRPEPDGKRARAHGSGS